MNKIILADTQGVFRAGIAKILSMEDDFRIIAQCPDADQLQNALVHFHGAIVLFASTLKQDPERLMQQISNMGSRGIAVLENTESPKAYLAANVHGLCFRGVSGRTFVECIRSVARGERAIQSEAGMPAQLEEDIVGTRVCDRLTPKEMQIVALIMQGCKNREIGLRLGTTEQVIKNYLRNVYDKTGISDRLELALFAIHHRTLATAATAVGKLIMATP